MEVYSCSVISSFFLLCGVLEGVNHLVRQQSGYLTTIWPKRAYLTPALLLCACSNKHLFISWPTILCFVWSASGPMIIIIIIVPWTRARLQIDEISCTQYLIIHSAALFLPSRVRVIYFSNGTCLFLTNGTGAGHLGSAKHVSVRLSSLWWGKRTSWKPSVSILDFLSLDMARIGLSKAGVGVGAGNNSPIIEDSSVTAIWKRGCL